MIASVAAMGTARILYPGILVSLVFWAGCSPSEVEDFSMYDEDASPTSERSPVGPGDAGTPAIDATTARDVAVPRDLPTILDIPTVFDRPTILDIPTIIDVPTIIDMGPPAPVCTLPAPAARPPAPGPDGSGVVRALAAEHPDWLRDSCMSMGGNFRFLFEAVRRLRVSDPRWGLDRRTGSLSGDIITYFHGNGCPEGSRETYMFDVIIRHCARPGVDAPAEAGWIDRSSEGAQWTLMGYDGTVPADAGPPADVGMTHTRPPPPNGRPTLEATASDHPDWLRNSCVTMGGNNDFLFEVVRRLRRMDPRWGLNWKRGRVGDMSQDVVSYYFGPGAPVEGSLEVYIFDVIAGHCGPTPGTTWIDQTGVGGADARWTLAGRTDL